MDQTNLPINVSYRVSRKGTVSGVVSVLPCSKTIPKSMWTNSAVTVSTRMFCACLSPIPWRTEQVTYNMSDWNWIVKGKDQAKGRNTSES